METIDLGNGAECEIDEFGNNADDQDIPKEELIDTWNKDKYTKNLNQLHYAQLNGRKR